MKKSLFAILQRGSRHLAHILLSPQCRLCGQFLVYGEEQIICNSCRQRVVRPAAAACPICGQWLPVVAERCGSCLLQEEPFNQHLSFAPYEETLQEIIRLYKYGQVAALAEVLSGYLADSFRQWANPAVDLIMPVPEDRSRKRDFRPTQQLAVTLGRLLRRPVQARNLVKKKSTPPQAGLSQSERLKNLRGAFALRWPGQVHGKTVLLVDDVWTTGSTIRACARTLGKAGANVMALTVARTPKH